jgi:hypothetical protein
VHVLECECEVVESVETLLQEVDDDARVLLLHAGNGVVDGHAAGVPTPCTV